MGDPLSTTQELLKQDNISLDDRLFIASLPTMLNNCDKYHKEAAKNNPPLNKKLSEMPEIRQKVITMPFYKENMTVADFLNLPNVNEPPNNIILSDIEKQISGGPDSEKWYYSEYKRYNNVKNNILEFYDVIENCEGMQRKALVCEQHLGELKTLIDPNYTVSYGITDMEVERRSVCDRHFSDGRMLLEGRENRNAPHNKPEESPRTIVKMNFWGKERRLDIPGNLPFGERKGTRAQEAPILDKMLKTLQLIAMQIELEIRAKGIDYKINPIAYNRAANEAAIRHYPSAIAAIDLGITELKAANRETLVPALEDCKKGLQEKLEQKIEKIKNQSRVGTPGDDTQNAQTISSLDKDNEASDKEEHRTISNN